jgi:hypothetical protein
MLPPAVVLAIVVEDATPLLAAASEVAARPAVLYAGDALEVRGRRRGFLEVYEHRRERLGYVRAERVREIAGDPEGARDLLAVLRFVRDTRGAEALCIAYAAAYLRAAAPAAIGDEVFDALGGCAARLASEASRHAGRSGKDLLAAHLEVAAGYGVVFRSFEREPSGATQICYEGDAFRRVLAAARPAPEHIARAVLALTAPECVDPGAPEAERRRLTEQRGELLERAPEPGTLADPELADRLLLREAAVFAGLAFQRARGGEAAGAEMAAARARTALLRAAPTPEEPERAARQEAAIRVGASRWASEPPRAVTGGALRLEGRPGGAPGQTCLQLFARTSSAPLLERCTYSQVWLGSARANAQGTALAVAVQPLEGWSELWILHRAGGSWDIEAIAPAAEGPELGYVDLAGWSPDGARILVAREARVRGKSTRSFELRRLDTLAIDKRADSPDALTPFHRWQSAEWRAETVALR